MSCEIPVHLLLLFPILNEFSLLKLHNSLDELLAWAGYSGISCWPLEENVNSVLSIVNKYF